MRKQSDMINIQRVKPFDDVTYIQNEQKRNYSKRKFNPLTFSTLNKDIQDGKKARKWIDRTRIGINLGPSPRHASSVALILNLKTGLVSPQFHCQYDDLCPFKAPLYVKGVKFDFEKHVLNLLTVEEQAEWRRVTVNHLKWKYIDAISNRLKKLLAGHR